MTYRNINKDSLSLFVHHQVATTMIGVQYFAIFGVCLLLPLSESFLPQSSLQRGLTRHSLSSNLFMSKWNDARTILTTTKPFSFVSQFIDQCGTMGVYAGKGHVVGVISLMVLGILVKTMLQMMSKSSLQTTGKQFNGNTNDESQSPYGRSETYNAELATKYFNKRPLKVMARSITIITTSVYFLFLLWKDKWMGTLLRWSKRKYDEQEAKRADLLADLLTGIGPAFIKIGQSLSIRTDLLSPAYIKGLTKLQVITTTRHILYIHPRNNPSYQHTLSTPLCIHATCQYTLLTDLLNSPTQLTHNTPFNTTINPP